MTNLNITPDPNPNLTVRRQAWAQTMAYITTALPQWPLDWNWVETTVINVKPEIPEGVPEWLACHTIVAELIKVGGQIKYLGYGLAYDEPMVNSIDVLIGNVAFTYENYTAARITIRCAIRVRDLIEAIDADELLAVEMYDLLLNAAVEHGITEFEAAVDRINKGV